MLTSAVDTFTWPHHLKRLRIRFEPNSAIPQCLEGRPTGLLDPLTLLRRSRISTLHDRVCVTAAMLVLEPIFESIFEADLLSERQVHVIPIRCYSGAAPSVPVASASMAAADKAVLYASVDAFFACRSWLFANVRSVMEPTPC
jgi:hypothetical protein